MKASVKKAWVKALRSGEYKQGQQWLCDAQENYCCLGVLYDVAVDADWIFSGGCWSTANESDAFLSGYNDALGLSRSHEIALANMNDAGTPFSEIADWIEANL